MLDGRKIKILEAIINDYIATAEPVGSRTIYKKYDFGISAATIRNEMSDLEDLGLITQPHTSSGRVPSQKGYRLYVDKLIKQHELSADETDYLQEVIQRNLNRIDYLMQETAKAISVLTQYTTIVKETRSKKIGLKHLQFIPVDETTILLVVVLDNKSVANHFVDVPAAASAGVISEFSGFLNAVLRGRPLDEIGPEVAAQIKTNLGEHAAMLGPVVDSVVHILMREEKAQIYLSGTNNILAHPEFSDIVKAQSIFQALEEQEILSNMLGDSRGKIDIMIGDENTLQEMKDCSIIKANYMLDGENFGTIGILGPTRMNYAQVVSVLNAMVDRINSFYL